METKEALMRIEHQEQDQSIIDDEDQLQTMTLNRKKSSRIRQVIKSFHFTRTHTYIFFFLLILSVL